MTTNSLLNTAESWEKIYTAFEQINFTAYDYDAVKISLLDYLKLNYPENFNDYTESAQIIAIIEMFAYVAELLAYRVDLSVHENLISTATRKQSILRLAKLISYTASRNLPLRGLVKIHSISTSENLSDSQGNSLSNRVITWDDQNNVLWREQFFAVVNKVLTQSYGNPFKSFQIDDTVFQQYEVKNLVETDTNSSSFQNGVIKTSVDVNGKSLSFELVPADVDQAGVFEREPNTNSYFTLLYADDGYGDSSDTTGFMMYLKQGTLQKLSYVFDINLPNRTIDINVQNINDSDIWVQQVDQRGTINSTWEAVPNVAGVNLVFNNVQNMNKYEIETLENDQVRLIFGDGDFAAMPTGIFNIWVRSSESANITVPKSLIADQTMTFSYTSKTGSTESCTFVYSLASALQNSAVTEDTAHIQSVAPSVYYTQDRMVNGQDYNSYLLQDPSILRLNAVNRTFAGQPKYINWNDASGAYQNIKIFGDDLRMYYDISSSATISTTSARSLIDDVIEPALSLPSIYNLLIYANYSTPVSIISFDGLVKVHPFIQPRIKFIEDIAQLVDGVPLKEKTSIQAFLDRHWYGEPDVIVQLDANLSDTSSNPKTSYAVVNGDTDNLIWDAKLKCVTKDSNTGVYTLIPTPNGTSGIQETVIRQKRFGIRYIPGRLFTSDLKIVSPVTSGGNFVSGISYTINYVGTTNFTLIGSVNNNIGTTFTATDSGTGTGTAVPGFQVSTLSYADINQTAASEEVYTVEILDTVGSFTVYSSVTGYQQPGIVGEAYSNGIISFKIGSQSLTPSIIPGDAFIIYIDKNTSLGRYEPYFNTTNLVGNFDLINDLLLPINAETLSYDPSDPYASWIFILERADDVNGNVSYWTVKNRNFNLVIESLTTNFWYNQDMQIIDPSTQQPVVDLIKILKSNLDVTKSKAIGVDQAYKVISDVKYSNGETNFGALSITPLISNSQTPVEFLNFIGSEDYVYFSIDQTNGNLKPIVTTSYIVSLFAAFDAGDATTLDGKYARKYGRNDLDFLWQHFTPNDNLIDPSPSNINDIYVLTSGYYSQVQDYVNGLLTIEPKPPTSLELRNSYSKLLSNKMISDTVIMHSGAVKFIFGPAAVPELRVKFRVIVSPGAKLTGDQIRSRVLFMINSYFAIDNWDFGQSFYATELNAVIHKDLATEISSVVMVPEFPTNYFGDLFYLRTGPHEIFVSCATIDNIEIITSLDRVTLKQKK